MRRRRSDHDRLLRAEARAQARAGAGLRRRLGWPLAALGGLLFVAGYVGAVAGFRVLPFDPHHVVAQWGGGLLAFVGVSLATSRPRRR